jgi:hypothetical protein
MMIEVLKQALTDAKRNERHNNVAETRYWLNQYKLIAEQAIKELERQKTNTVTLTQTNIGIGERGMEAYEAAKKRGWVGLADEEIQKVIAEVSQIPPIDFTTTTYARAIEVKLKEKNS